LEDSKVLLLALHFEQRDFSFFRLTHALRRTDRTRDDRRSAPNEPDYAEHRKRDGRRQRRYREGGQSGESNAHPVGRLPEGPLLPRFGKIVGDVAPDRFDPSIADIRIQPDNDRVRLRIAHPPGRSAQRS